MSKSKPPAFQLMAKDLLSDTLTWSAQELGVHVRLMCWSWDNGPVPADPKRIDRIDRDASAVWETVGPKWQPDGNGGLVNDRLERTRAEQQAYRQRQSERGKKSAEARAKKPKRNRGSNAGSTVVPTPVQPALQPNGQPNFNNKEGVGEDVVVVPNGAERVPTAEELDDARFEALWVQYGRVGVKTDALKHWRKLKEPDKMAIEAKVGAYVLSTSGDDLQYRKYLEGWINPDKRRWELPIIHRNKPTATDQRRATTSDRDKPITIGQR